jgi:hypothetical protein
MDAREHYAPGISPALFSDIVPPRRCLMEKCRPVKGDSRVIFRRVIFSTRKFLQIKCAYQSALLTDG